LGTGRFVPCKCLIVSYGPDDCETFFQSTVSCALFNEAHIFFEPH